VFVNRFCAVADVFKSGVSEENKSTKAGEFFIILVPVPEKDISTIDIVLNFIEEKKLENLHLLKATAATKLPKSVMKAHLFWAFFSVHWTCVNENAQHNSRKRKCF